MNLTLYYATNREHIGSERAKPEGYGERPSKDGIQNLRFGTVSITMENDKVNEYLNDVADGAKGNGTALADYIKTCKQTIDAKPEVLNEDNTATFGSHDIFPQLKQAMSANKDVLIYVHGYNVEWKEAVAAAASLQIMLNRKEVRENLQEVIVFLFSWPSDGKMLLYLPYFSDRHDAAGSGIALGRGILKLRDFLEQIRKEAIGNVRNQKEFYEKFIRDTKSPDGLLCGRNIHLLCHSMGNFVLQNTLPFLAQHTVGNVFEKLFDHVFLCSADVDDNVLEKSEAMGSLHELGKWVNVYTNSSDKALHISSTTKNSAERLGLNGPARMAVLHRKIHHINCSDIVEEGITEHSYYLNGLVNNDIRRSINGVPQSARNEYRDPDNIKPNVWWLKK